MLLERQRRLLALLDALGGTVNSMDFQKLLFLYTQEEEMEPTYEFIPYRLGGFSFTSYADKRRLIEQGFLADEERHWSLTETGHREARLSTADRVRIDRFARRHAEIRGDELVKYIYRRHPYYAIRSEIVDRVLANDTVALQAIREARPVLLPPGLYTIGYQGRSLEAYLNRLIQAGITLLCDVRRNPLSRKYGFSKSTLSRACDSVGVRYEHLPELGIASDRRRTLEWQADYDALFADYERHDLPDQGEALERIASWVCLEQQRVALTCFERRPEQCHRHCVARALEQRFGRELAATHL